MLASGGATIGVLATYSGLRDVIVVITGAAFLVSLLFILGKKWRASRNFGKRAEYFLRLRDPDPEAIQFANLMGVNNGSVIGKVIEVWPHHTLERMVDFNDLGIRPDEITFERPETENFNEALAKCGGLKEFGEPNGRKYGIRKLPSGTMDDSTYSVRFFQTRWNTYLSVRTVVEKDANLRWQLANIDPELSLLPQSMALHYLVRFVDGAVLAYWRQDGIQFEPNKWSFSGEEQINAEDFSSFGVPIAEHLFRRAFVEEVLGQRGNDSEQLNRIWAEDCAAIIQSYRIWSFFLEEYSGVFEPFGVFQLNIKAEALRLMKERAASAGWGTDDREGRWYVIEKEEIGLLLAEGRCRASRLLGHRDETLIQSSNLHSTSRYRLWRLYAALNRQERPTLSSLHWQ